MSQINGETEIYGIIGYPIAHTFSPAIHNTLFQKFDLNCIYIPFLVRPEELEVAIKGLRAINVKGFNVTLPHKISVIKFLDSLDETSLLTGAVNTIKLDHNKFYGYNTDVYGFLKALEPINIKSKDVLLLGAGGAARAVFYGLLKQKVKKIYVANIIPEEAKRMVDEFKKIISTTEVVTVTLEKDLLKKLHNISLVVNATSCGMKKTDEIIIYPTEPEIVYYDLIYNPLETKFLKQAKRIGAKIIPGLNMLIYQALSAFEIWTGIKIDQTKIYFDKLKTKLLKKWNQLLKK